MSTSFDFRRGDRGLTLAWAAVTLVACALLWPGSKSAGGGREAQAMSMVADVASVTRMTSLCRTVAEGIAVNGVRGRIAAHRPTASLFAVREQRGVDAWDAAHCPPQALPGLAYGVAEIANDDDRRRHAGFER